MSDFNNETGLVERHYVWSGPKLEPLTPTLLDTDKLTRQEWEQFMDTQPQTYQPKPDDFVNPDHYRTNGIECIEYQRATSTPEEFQGYLKNCCVKYLHRMRTKDDPLKNLLKAQWYLNRLVEEFKKQ